MYYMEVQSTAEIQVLTLSICSCFASTNLTNVRHTIGVLLQEWEVCGF